MIRNLVAFVRSLRNPVPDHAAQCPDFVEPPADYLEPVADVRQAMRERLFDDLCADWAREIEACLPDYVAEWEAS